MFIAKMWFYCFSQNLQYYSQAVEQNNVFKLSCSKCGHSLPFRIVLVCCMMDREKKTMPLTPFSTVFHMISLYLTKVSHTSCLCIACEEVSDLKRQNIHCLLFGTKCNVSKQRERKCHLLSVINPMEFVETLFWITEYHQLSIVHSVMSDNLHKHQCCLPSLSSSDMVWGNGVVLLTPCPWETGLTGLFTVIG